MTFDAIVIGSGFGGAITGCRLAEAGYRVLILERGRRWDSRSYPRRPEDPWIWSHEHPERENGWVDLRVFPRMAVVQGAGVGGGSLIYANVSVEAPSEAFRRGWPREITLQELKPYYDAVARFLNVQPVPANQWTARMRLVQEAAEKCGYGDRLRPLDLAVSFDPTWSYDQPDPHAPSKSRRFTNAQGAQQGTCVHLGNCDIGCDVGAKNTLDLNYIVWAEKHHAEVRSLHLVTSVEPTRDRYRVFYDRLEGGQRRPGSETARLVIVAAGSLGSTELLLRCRDEARTLPNVSRCLGRNWSSNGDFLTPALHTGRAVAPTQGPTIGSAIDFLDRSVAGQSFWVQDGGFPALVGDYLRSRAGRARPRGLRARLLLDAVQRLSGGEDPFGGVMPWFAQGVDAGNGVLSLRRPWWLLGRRCLHLYWDVARSEPTISAIVAMHARLASATGGYPIVPLTWSVARDLITPHPLGGCNMGDAPTVGVVNHAGEVFGYRNLYVADAAIIPEAIGVNPSRTIGALAERVATILTSEGR